LGDAKYAAALEDWIRAAKRADAVSFIASRGYKLVKQGQEWVGPCPRCGGRDRFSINPRRGVFNCRGCGVGGDFIEMVMHIDGCGFNAACKALTGRDRPSKDATQKEDRHKTDPDISSEPKTVSRAPRAPLDPTQIWNAGWPVEATHAAAYLEARGLHVSPNWTFDLRFAPALEYFGYSCPEAKEQEVLGVFPAMLAAIRDASGQLVGVHRTYLDPAEPRKLDPPGDKKRNSAKKVVGKVTGGMIRLSPPGPLLLLGEGIETSRSAYQLGIGGDDPAVAAAVSLINLSGGAVGSIPHPTADRRTIPDGEPDPEKPGIILPPEVEEVILLGDGDSDRAYTLARLLVAGRRFRSQGKAVFVCMADEGVDFNDMLCSWQRATQEGVA